MAKNRKGPRSLIPVSQEKKPRVSFHEDWREMRPVWRVCLLEMVSPYGWHRIDPDSANQVRERLAAFESMTWKEILVAGGYRNHLISVRRLSADAQARLVALQQDDVDNVVSLGVAQMCRIFGILEHNVLKLLWWDPEHLVCPSVRE